MLNFFLIWWAWVSFTWFASAYDTDDVPFRLLTLVHIAGVLILASGVPGALSDHDLTTVIVGYVIMRTAMAAHWLRAAVEHPAGRGAALRYGRYRPVPSGGAHSDRAAVHRDRRRAGRRHRE